MKTRQQMIENHRRIRDEIRQIFTDAASWNDNHRKPHEPEIDPNPDGQMGKIEKAYSEMLDREDAKHLWCVHVIGPDELQACDNRDHAVKVATETNEWAAKQDFTDLTFRAEVAIWPHDAAIHAEDLIRWNAERALKEENASAMAPPPQRLPSTKDVPGG